MTFLRFICSESSNYRVQGAGASRHKTTCKQMAQAPFVYILFSRLQNIGFVQKGGRCPVRAPRSRRSARSHLLIRFAPLPAPVGSAGERVGGRVRAACCRLVRSFRCSFLRGITHPPPALKGGGAGAQYGAAKPREDARLRKQKPHPFCALGAVVILCAPRPRKQPARTIPGGVWV